MRFVTPWFEVDARARSLVLTTIHNLETTGVVDELGDAYRAVLDRGFRQFFITDIGRPPRYETAVRHRIAEMVQTLAPLERKWSLGAAIVVRSPLVRATMTAIRWLSGPVVPETYVSDLRQAADLAEMAILGAGLELDDQARTCLGSLRAREAVG